jgi:hypothetical protein
VFTSLDTSADHSDRPGVTAAQHASGENRGRRSPDARNISAVHHTGSSSGLRIEQVYDGQVVGQINLQIALEPIDDLLPSTACQVARLAWVGRNPYRPLTIWASAETEPHPIRARENYLRAQ